MSITVKESSVEVTAYDKEITFIYEGKTYEVMLHWDTNDGYELMWNKSLAPEWYATFEDDNNGDSLEYLLDVESNSEVSL